MSIYTNPSSSTPEETAAYVRALLDLLGEHDPFALLHATPAAVRELCSDVSAEALGRPEAPGKWSMRQVLAHLADSELVWGWRLRMVLAHDRPPLTGYDQDRWAERLQYELSDPEQSLRTFALLRENNLRLVDRATPQDLARVGVHSERGEESLEHLVKLYAAHDLLHLRQLDRIRSKVPAQAAPVAG